MTLLGVWGGSVGYQLPGRLEHENPISEAATGSPLAVSGACGARVPSRAAQCVERLCDQIGGTEATCGPSRPKGLVIVMGTQGYGEHPAAASRR